MFTDFIKVKCSKKDTFNDLIEDIMSEFKVERKAINLYLDDDCIYFGEDSAEAFKVFKKDDILGEIFQQNINNGTVELIQYFKDASFGLSGTRTVIVKSSCTCHGKILKFGWSFCIPKIRKFLKRFTRSFNLA